MKKLLHNLLDLARRSFLRKPIVKIFIKLHNLAYRGIGFFALEQGIHPKHRLMNYHKFFMDSITSEDKVLDIGCGNGYLSYDIAQKAKEIVGIDLNEKNINFAKNHYKRCNLNFVHGDALKWLPDKKIDVIVLSNVLEHIEERVDFLSALKKKFNTKILIRVPVITRDWLTLYKKEMGIEWRLDDTHFIEYTLGSFKNEVGVAGYKIDNYSVQFGEIWSIIVPLSSTPKSL